MAYYIDLFSPETFETFRNSDKKTSGFRERQKGVASEIIPLNLFFITFSTLSIQ